MEHPHVLQRSYVTFSRLRHRSNFVSVIAYKNQLSPLTPPRVSPRSFPLILLSMSAPPDAGASGMSAIDTFTLRAALGPLLIGGLMSTV